MLLIWLTFIGGAVTLVTLLGTAFLRKTRHLTDYSFDDLTLPVLLWL
jgi:hypothetical protein